MARALAWGQGMLRLWGACAEKSLPPADHCGLVSLLDMRRFYAESLLAAASGLHAAEVRARARTDLPDSSRVRNLGQPLRDLISCFRTMEMEDLLQRVTRFAEEASSEAIGLEVALDRLREVRRSLASELQGKLFLKVQDRFKDFYDESRISEAAKKSFPEAELELRSAWSCLAIDQSTAAVVVGMRAADILIRAMGSRLGLEEDDENWANALNRIVKRVKDLQGILKNSPEREHMAEMSAAAMNFGFIRVAWRNRAMHATARYGSSQAQEILEHVCQIATALAPAFENP